MTRIRHTKTLFYCDGPQVIEARDDEAQDYVGVAIPSQEDRGRFLLKSVNPECLENFRDGILDLRSLILGGNGKEWLLVGVTGNSTEVHDLILRNDPLEATGFLPDAGFFLQTS